MKTIPINSFFVTLLSGVLSFTGLMGQTGAESGKPKKSTWYEVSLYGVGGRYFESVSEVSYENYYNQLVPLVDQSTSFYAGAVDFSYTIRNDRYQRATFGARLFLGDEVPQVTYISSGGGPVYGISPYLSMNWRAIGFNVGFMLGQTKIPIQVPDKKWHEGMVISKNYAWTKFTPAFGIRLGPEDIVFAEVTFPGFFPTSTPYPVIRAGLGSGLGRTNGTKIAAGYAAGVYVEGVYPVLDYLKINALLATNLKGGLQNKTMFSLGVIFRFGYKEVAMKQRRSLPGPIPSRTSKFSDIDQNPYRVFSFGRAMITLSDLAVTRFRNGDFLPDTLMNNEEPVRYSWAAVTDPRGLCPTGWHVPDEAEWNSLANFITGSGASGQESMKEFAGGEDPQQWWSSTSVDEEKAQSFYFNSKTNVMMLTAAPKSTLLPVRCIRKL